MRFLDKPGKPSKPELVDWDKDHVDLTWEPPSDDGGAIIEKYIIEKKDRLGKWEKAKEVPGGETAATVGDLEAGEEYQFRIVAVNKAGPGEASEPSERMIAKPRNCNL